MNLFPRGRHLVADVTAVLAGTVAVLAVTQVLTATPAPPPQCDPILVWSSIEPGKASELDDQDGVVQKAAAESKCKITVVPKGSGTAEDALTLSKWSSSTDPDVWLPTDTLWTERWQARTGAAKSLKVLGSIATSRMAVIVKRDLADSLGWTDTINWSDLRTAASQGKLQLVKENALNSTSGAMATLLAHQAAARDGNLTADLVKSGYLDDKTIPIEHAVTEYPGEITQFLKNLTQKVNAGHPPPGVNAMILQRALYHQYDLDKVFVERKLPETPDPRVNHPFVVRPGLTPEREASARKFFETLNSRNWQTALTDRGFEPPARDDTLRGRWDGATINAVLDRWRDHGRRRLRIAVLADQSGSADSLTPQLRSVLQTALRRLSRTDHAAVYGFPSQPGGYLQPLAAGEDVFNSPPDLADALPATFHGLRHTPLIEAVEQAAVAVSEADPLDPDNPETPAVVVLTDGEQDSITPSAALMDSLEHLRRLERDKGVKVYIVLLGSAPLQRIGDVTDGRSLAGVSTKALLVEALTATGSASAAAKGPGDRVMCLEVRPDCPTDGPVSKPDVRARDIVNSIVRQLGGG